MIEISTARLKSYIKFLSKVSRSRNVMPVLGMVKLELANDILTFTSTNSEATIIITDKLNEYSYDKNSDNEIKSTEKNFSALIPMKTLSELVNVISSDTVKIKEEIEGDNISVSISHGKSKSKMKSMPVDDFPTVQHEEKKALFTVKDNEWINISPLSSFAMSTDISRPVLNTVHVKSQGKYIIFESAEGATASRYFADITAYDNFDINIPGHSFKLIDNLNVMTFGLYSGNKLYVESKLMFGGSIEMIFLLDESGQYPNLDIIVPTDETIKYHVNTKEIKNIIKRASIFQDLDALVFSGDGNNLIICATSNAYGNTTDTVELEEKGLVFEIGYDKSQIGTIIANMKGSRTKIYHGNSSSSITVISSIPGHYCLLAPVIPEKKHGKK